MIGSINSENKMELWQIVGISGIIFIIIIWILTDYNIKYKGKCILHDWEYKFEYGDWWKVTGSFLRSNERWICRKCNKKSLK